MSGISRLNDTVAMTAGCWQYTAAVLTMMHARTLVVPVPTVESVVVIYDRVAQSYKH